MRLTDEQIRATMLKVRMIEGERADLERRALAGEQAARFAVYFLAQKYGVLTAAAR